MYMYVSGPIQILSLAKRPRQASLATGKQIRTFFTSYRELHSCSAILPNTDLFLWRYKSVLTKGTI